MKTISINFQIPASWQELSDKQLRFVYKLIAKGFDSSELKILSIFRWSRTKVVGRNENGCYLLKKNNCFFEVSPIMIAEILPYMGWMDSIPQLPVRLDKIKLRKGVAADFQGVALETFIICDNLYQGYLQTHDDEMLEEIGKILYRDSRLKFKDWERISIFYWMAALKEFFANRFHYFFRPSANMQSENLLGGPQLTTAALMQESMDSMIRALTKGDITKEEEILRLDTWRALTELDAQAREYQELNAKYNANK